MYSTDEMVKALWHLEVHHVDHLFILSVDLKSVKSAIRYLLSDNFNDLRKYSSKL